MAQPTRFSSSAGIRRFVKDYVDRMRPCVTRLVGELFAGMLAAGGTLLSEVGRRIKDETTLARPGKARTVAGCPSTAPGASRRRREVGRDTRDEAISGTDGNLEMEAWPS